MLRTWTRSVALRLSGVALSACTPADPSWRAIPAGPDASAEPAAMLSDTIDTTGLRENNQRNRGLAAADFDEDGDIDLYLANPLDRSRLYWNAGDCTFVPATETPTTGQDAAAAAIDYDGDGDLDLFIACGGFEAACPNGLFRNDGIDAAGEVVFTDVSETSGIAEQSTASFGGSWADYDLDGDIDLFMPSKVVQTGDVISPVADALLRNNGDGTFTDVTAEAGVGEPHTADHHQSAWLDADLDGDPDLMVPAFAGINRFFVNQGDGTFIDEASQRFVQLPWAAFGVIAEDFDHDGDLDALFSAHASHDYDDLGELHDSSAWFENDGEGRFTNRTSSVGLPGEDEAAHTDDDDHVGTMGFQVGDLDLDGNLDVFFGNGNPFEGQINGLWEAEVTDRTLRFLDRTALIDTPPTLNGEAYPYRSHGAAFFDCDGDDRVDLFIGNGGDSSGDHQREPNRLFLNAMEDSPAWVEIELRGADANTSGIGARVVVRDGDTEVWRHQSVTSGFNGSVPHDIRVGLGARTGPFSVTAYWPGGKQTTVEGVSSEERVVLQQP